MAAGDTEARLIAEVGGLLDQDITDSTTPSRDDVITWLNRGAIQVYKLLPVEHLSDVTHEEAIAGSEVLGTALSKTLLRIVDVQANGVSCEKVTDATLTKIHAENPHRYNSKQPAYSIKGSGGSTKIKTYPTSTVVVNVVYIPNPTPYIKDTGVDDAYTVPYALEEFVVKYASIMAREQDEEPGQFQLYMRDWVESVQMAYSIPAQNTDT